MNNTNFKNEIRQARNVWEGQAVQEEQLNFYNKFCADLLRPHLGKRILDIGIGLGNVAEFLIDNAEAYIGIDIVEDHIRYSRERFRDRPFDGHVADVEKEKELYFLQDKDFDSIVSVNCFEHLRDDVSVLTSLCDQSKNGTCFAFMVPAHQALYGALDIQAGHFRRYTKKELRRKCEDAGFIVEGMRYVNIIGALGWFLMGKLFRPAKSKIPISPEQLNWRWKILYGAVFAAKYPVMGLLALEKQFESVIGLSLIAWGAKQ